MECGIVLLYGHPGGTQVMRLPGYAYSKTAMLNNGLKLSVLASSDIMVKVQDSGVCRYTKSDTPTLCTWSNLLFDLGR